MSLRISCAVLLALLPCFLAACAVTRGGLGAPGRNASQSANALCAKLAGVLPPGWRYEIRPVTIATEEGESSKEIPCFRNSLGMEFVHIPAGRFDMGSKTAAATTAKRFGGDAKDYADERPRHAVRITRAFLMGATEVTNAQYRRFRPGHCSGYYEGQSLDGDSHPAACVSQDDGRDFCAWLSRQDGLNYRLPTEAEWEYACRAGSTSPYPWGDEIRGDRCNFADANAASLPWRDEKVNDGFAVTSPVGSYPANAFGLYDMTGNLWEWCADWYGDKYYAESPASDPPGAPSNRNMCRVLRGGSWMNAAGFCRSSFRLMASQANRSVNNGLRIVVEIPQR